MALSVQFIKSLAGAVDAGRQAFLAGRMDNPFAGKDEALRIAFHLGLNLGDNTLRLPTEEELLASLAALNPTISSTQKVI